MNGAPGGGGQNLNISDLSSLVDFPFLDSCCLYRSPGNRIRVNPTVVVQNK